MNRARWSPLQVFTLVWLGIATASGCRQFRSGNVWGDPESTRQSEITSHWPRLHSTKSNPDDKAQELAPPESHDSVAIRPASEKSDVQLVALEEDIKPDSKESASLKSDDDSSKSKTDKADAKLPERLPPAVNLSTNNADESFRQIGRASCRERV